MSQSGLNWSQRRAAVKAEADAEVLAAQKAEIVEKQSELEDKSDAEILEVLNLKDPNKMVPGDDFAAFMKAEVPDRLRKRALRTLWRSNPVLACVDDLVDYGDDFKAEWNGADLIKTVYRVGKGMLPDPDVEDCEDCEDGKDGEDGEDGDMVAAPVADTEEESGVQVEQETVGHKDVPEPVVLAFTVQEPVTAAEEPIAFSVPGHAPDIIKPRRMRFEFEKV